MHECHYNLCIINDNNNIAGYSVFSEGASDTRHPWSSAASRHLAAAANRTRSEELSPVPERPRQIRVHGVAPGPQHAAILQRSHAAH